MSFVDRNDGGHALGKGAGWEGLSLEYAEQLGLGNMQGNFLRIPLLYLQEENLSICILTPLVCQLPRVQIFGSLHTFYVLLLTEEGSSFFLLQF